MSLEIVKKVIEDFLNRDFPEVLAIKGKWGTGKTYTWNKIIKSSKNNNKLALDKYAYVSLFGINSLEALKIAIFEQTVERELIEEGVSLKTLKNNTDLVAKSLGRKSLSFLQGIPWIKNFGPFLHSASFLSVTKTLICFDDFERKGTSLSAKDILGLISILKESKGCKVVLIFNESLLDDNAENEYQTFREKVIDIELSFLPTPSECSSLIFNENDDVNQKLKECSEKLNITNIRILKKIKNLCLEVCMHLASYEKEVRDQTCHTLALYTWCYYSGEKYTPGYKYVKDLGYVFLGLDDKKDLSEQEKEWNSILQNYSYTSTDEFDLVLGSVVENGYVIEHKLKEEADKLNARIISEKGGNAFSQAWRLYHDTFDNNEEDLVTNIAEKFKQNVKFISPLNLNGTVKLFRELGKGDLADELIEFYIENNSDKKNLFNLNSYPFRGDIDDNKVIKRFDEIFLETKKTKTLKDILYELIGKNGWGAEDEKILSEASPEEYYKFFKSESGENLPLYVEKVLQFGRFTNSSDVQKQIAEKATQALKKIASESKLNERRVQKFGIKI